MRMKEWIAKLNGFLKLNDRDILNNAGRISHELAKQRAEKEYDIYHQKTLQKPSKMDKAFDEAVNKTTQLANKAQRKNKQL